MLLQVQLILRENCPPFRVNKVESRAERLHFHFLVEWLKSELPSTSIALQRKFLFSLTEESTVSRPKRKGKKRTFQLWLKIYLAVSLSVFLFRYLSYSLSFSLCLSFLCLHYYQQSIIALRTVNIIDIGVPYKWQEKRRGTLWNALKCLSEGAAVNGTQGTSTGRLADKNPGPCEARTLCAPYFL